MLWLILTGMVFAKPDDDLLRHARFPRLRPASPAERARNSVRRYAKLVLMGLLLWQSPVQAGFFATDTGADIPVTQLPVEARDTLQLIKQGGPFPYPRDGIVFSNREHRLPEQSRGYYREYTVKTPGVQHRGARRIVCGVVPECYYTNDHYRTFKRIRE